MKKLLMVENYFNLSIYDTVYFQVKILCERILFQLNLLFN